ncbi:MAG: hypothetical protein GKR93_09125 [Gammaproteobacteria bacterium]|nr:hypothetical protein [Gammaproteobacteria bacterium]
MSSSTQTLIFFLFLSFTTYLAAEKATTGWDVYGSNTLRGSVYDASGPGSGSPYPFEGDMYFDELSVFFSKEDSDYASWRGEVSGLYNVNDDYRSQDFGLVPERMNLTRESGEGVIPYRVEIGDYFAYYSYLTLQRSLKGLQLELQPFTNDRQQHSIIITSGANENNWRDLTPQDNYVNGLSWLVQDQKLGSWTFNIAHNFQDNSFKAGTLDRNQYTYSVAGEVPFTLGNHFVSIEAEAAHFGGDHNGRTGAASGQDRSDNGYLVEMRGNHKKLPWNYRFRFERYGQDFRPTGAVVTPDRESYELHSGWRFQNNIQIRLRAQRFEDALETSNSLRTRTYGVNLTGPLLTNWYTGLNGRIDAFVQNRDNELTTISQLSQTINVNLNAPLPQGWTGRLALFLQNVKNRLGRSGDTLTRQVNIGLDRGFTISGWQAYITPGFTLRILRKGGRDDEEYRPSLALRLNRDAHSLSMNYGLQIQDRTSTLGGIDVDTHTFNADYRYRYKHHTLGFEANLFGRESELNPDTEAYRISAYWTMTFDKPAVPATTVRQADVSSKALPAGEWQLNLITLGPESEIKHVESELKAANISRGTQQGGYTVYETAVLRNIFRRQRLALAYQAGVLRDAVVVIDFDEVGNRDSNAQSYERIRQSLIRQLGSPSRTIDEGDFTSTLARDVNDERFIRITEWQTERGSIRFGIPRRLDGQVRMEIQHRSRFPSYRDTLWSVEAVR